MTIPWEDLELLVAIAEERSFSAAARRLALTQPTVSRRITALEQRLGKPLFLRDVDGARPTETGAALLPAALQMERYAKEAAARLVDSGEAEGAVTFGYHSEEASEVILWLSELLIEQHPRLHLHTRKASAGELASGQIDLYLGPAAIKSDDVVPLGQLTLAMGVYVSRALSKGCQDPTNADLPWLTPGRKPSAQLTTADHHLRVRAAERGLGKIVLPRLGNHQLSELEGLRGEVARAQIPFFAHRPSCFLAGVRATYTALLSGVERAHPLSFSPAKNSPFGVS